MYKIMLINMFLVIVVYMIFYLMFYKLLYDYESISAYECGYNPSSMTRISFSFRFFLISILFIIFDVEISLMLPIPFIMNNMYSMWIFNIFMLILIIGLIYEYYCGSLDWLDIFISKV